MKQELPITPASAAPGTSGARLAGIDALRAVAMLLGMLFHSLIAYRVVPLPTWPYDDRFHHWGFDFIYLFIHSFRMPLFFLIAGFFCRLLLYKTGEKSFISHRFKRIVLPFLISLVVILPFTIFPFLVFKYVQQNPGNWNLAVQLAGKRLLRWNGMAHLWFLYYLIIYYIAAIAALRLKNSGVANGIITRVMSWLRHHVTMSILAIGAIWLILLPSPELYLHVDTGILPKPVFLLFYALFFAIGWLLHKMPQPFAPFVRNMGWWLASGIALSVLLFVLEYNGHLHNTVLLASFKFVAAVQILCLVYGVIGLFLRHFSSAGEKWRYISDASYWMYLVHLGLIAGLQVLFIYLGILPVLRFPLVLAITVAVSLASYHWCVRFTVLGDYLHGKRERKAKVLNPATATGRK